MKRHSSFVLNSEKRNLKDCCGLPLQKTTTRWVAVTSKASIFTLSLIGQAIGCCASIFTESFVESQKRPGAERGVGFSGTGAMQTNPNPDSVGNAGLNRDRANRMMLLILITAPSTALYGWLSGSIRLIGKFRYGSRFYCRRSVEESCVPAVSARFCRLKSRNVSWKSS